jgi:hypothetical protein
VPIFGQKIGCPFPQTSGLFLKKRKKTKRIVRPPILIFTMLYVAEMFCSHLATYPNFLL